MARVLRLSGDFLPERMLELGEQIVGRLPLIFLAASFDIDAIGIPLKQPLRSLDEMDAAVRPL